jgi:hypothetical protein
MEIRRLRKYLIPFMLIPLFSLSVLHDSILTAPATGIGLTSAESQIIGMINGTEAYGYDLEMESIAYNHTLSNYSFRSGGSSGANATADWLKEQFENLGLETSKEPFQFTTWEVLSKPQLLIDDDGNFTTTNDQVSIDTFQCEHYSWPTQLGGAFADLAVLPLPLSSSRSQVGLYPINTTEWNAVNTTGKVVLIGREVRWADSWESAYRSKLASQPPTAVVYCRWYDWEPLALTASIGGRPASNYGPYYWNQQIAVGTVDYNDGLWIRNRETRTNVSAYVNIETLIGSGTHYNVVGKLVSSRRPDKFVIVSSHYDTVMDSGFSDNGAGTAGVLELARVLVEANTSGLLRPNYSILFTSFADEEMYNVGATNYVIRHKAEMSNVVAVLNLDCIGNGALHITQTNPGPRFDLDQLVYASAQELGIDAVLETGGAADAEVFRNPSQAGSNYLTLWGIDAGISNVVAVQSSTLIVSYPNNLIHTSYDNSTSTATLNWTDPATLENHIKVAGLSIARIATPSPVDINSDGTVNILDIAIVAAAYGTMPGDPKWNPAADLDGNSLVNIIDVTIVARDYGKVA